MENNLNTHKKTLFPYIKFSFKEPIKNENLILIKTLIKKIIYYGICVDDIEFINIPKNEITVSYIIKRLKCMTPNNIYKPSNPFIIITNEVGSSNNNVFNINDYNIIEKLELFFKDRVSFKNKNIKSEEEFLCFFENILKHSEKIVLFDSQYLKQITLKNKDRNRSHLKHYREGLNLLLETYYNVSDISNKKVSIIMQQAGMEEKKYFVNKEQLKKKLIEEKKYIANFNINVEFNIYYKIPHHRYWLFYLYSKEKLNPTNRPSYGIITDYGLTDFTQVKHFKSEFYHVETDDYSSDLGKPVLIV